MTGCSATRLVGREYSRKSVRMRKQSDGGVGLPRALEAIRMQNRPLLTVGSLHFCPTTFSEPHRRPSLSARSLARAPSRKSWVSTSTSDVSVTPQSPGRRKSFANAFLAPLRNTFRSSSSARPTSELAPCSSEFVQSPSSPDRASPSGLTDHLSPSTPNLSPSTSTPPLPPPRRRWTASGQRTPATDLSLARTRHLSNPLPPPTRPIPPIPHVHFVPRPSVTPPVPMQIAISTDDYGPSTPIDDSSSSFVLLEAAAAAASKARPKVRPLQLAPSVTVSFPELPSCSPGSGSGSGSGYPAPAPPSRARPTLYTLSHSGARSTSAIPSGTESGDRAERGRADAGGSEGDVIDPSLLAEDDGRCSVRADHTAAPTVSSLSSILPWLQELDLDSIMPALSNAE